MGKVLLLTSYFAITPALLLLCIIFFSFLAFHKHQQSTITSLLLKHKTVAYAALPTVQTITGNDITKEDARVELIRQFFAKYESPLEPFAKEIVEVSDQHNLDFRLLPAIAMQESNLCKKAPVNSFNCWGFGIYGQKMTTFSGYLEAVKTIAKTLARDYKENGLHTPEEIMTKYTPSNNGAWAYSVNHFMDALK